MTHRLTAEQILPVIAGIAFADGTKLTDLVSNIINFLVIAFIVFLAYKQLSRFKLVEDKTKPAPVDKK